MLDRPQDIMAFRLFLTLIKHFLFYDNFQLVCIKQQKQAAGLQPHTYKNVD